MNRSRASLYSFEVLALALTWALFAHGQEPKTLNSDRSSIDCRGEDIVRFVDATLPLWSGPLPKQTEWQACARIIDPSQPERRFCIAKDYDGGVRGQDTVATGSSLHDQFCNLKQTSPAATPEALVAKASVSERDIKNRTALRRLAHNLESLELSLALPNALVMDYPTYELEMQTQYGSTLRLELAGSPATHPVVKWIRDVEALSGDDSQKQH